MDLEFGLGKVRCASWERMPPASAFTKAPKLESNNVGARRKWADGFIYDFVGGEEGVLSSNDC